MKKKITSNFNCKKFAIPSLSPSSPSTNKSTTKKLLIKNSKQKILIKNSK